MNKARYLIIIKDGGEQCHHHHIDQIRGGITKELKNGKQKVLQRLIWISEQWSSTRRMTVLLAVLSTSNTQTLECMNLCQITNGDKSRTLNKRKAIPSVRVLNTQCIEWDCEICVLILNNNANF